MRGKEQHVTSDMSKEELTPLLVSRVRETQEGRQVQLLRDNSPELILHQAAGMAALHPKWKMENLKRASTPCRWWTGRVTCS